MKKNATPKLVCNITGNSRVTTREYLDARLAALEITEAHYLENYCCKDAMKMLRAGKTVAEIRTALKSDKKHPITDADIKEFLRVNGKKNSQKGPVMSPREQRFLAEQAAKTPAAKVEVKAPATAAAAPAKK